MFLAAALGIVFEKNGEPRGSQPPLPSESYFYSYARLHSFRALYFNMTDCFLCIGPFHMPLVISQRSCSANSHSKEMCCLQACQFYICTSSNVISLTLTSLAVSPSSEMRGKGMLPSVGKYYGAMPALPSEQNRECWRGLVMSGSQVFSGFILLEGETTMGLLCPKGSKIRKQSQAPLFFFFLILSS